MAPTGHVSTLLSVLGRGYGLDRPSLGDVDIFSVRERLSPRCLGVQLRFKPFDTLRRRREVLSDRTDLRSQLVQALVEFLCRAGELLKTL